MNWIWDRPWLAAGALAVVIAAAAGLGLGVASTGDAADAEAERAVAYETAYAQSFDRVSSISRDMGREDGLERGRIAGKQAGDLEGFDLGGGIAGLRLIEDQLAEAEAARATAEAELAERQANCGTIARAPDVCPTDAELADFRAAVAAAKAKEEQQKKPGNNRPGNRPPGNQPGSEDG